MWNALPPNHGSLGADASKIGEFIQRSRDVVRQIPERADSFPSTDASRDRNFVSR